MTIQDAPSMLAPRSLSADWTLLPSSLPVPGVGVLPVNSFLLAGAEPLLVDTGLAALAGDYLAALGTRIDLRALRWIWLSHLDPDHTGNLCAVLEAAPDARVVTSFLGRGKMLLQRLPTERVHLLEHGQSLQLPDRELLALRPPYYDAPETLGFLDSATRTLFVSDCFGALLPGPAASLDDVADEVLRAGLLAWSAIDAPWLADMATTQIAHRFVEINRLSPSRILSSHLPPIEGDARKLARWLLHAPDMKEAA